MVTTEALDIRRFASQERDTETAARELCRELAARDAELILFFCDPGFDLDALGRILREECGDATVIGCTSAGEICGGYTEQTLAGLSVARSEDFRVVSEVIEGLSSFDIGKAQALVDRLESELEAKDRTLTADRCFAMLLIDGMSLQEEQVTYKLQGSLGDVKLFGGSAGDGLEFGKTFVYRDGAFVQDAAILALVHTARPFEVFQTQHFEATSEKVVVTEADVAKRVVQEINGLPAAQEYARLLGLDVADLTPAVFARNPMMVRMGGQWYVRSIQQIHDDGSLLIYCAIDEGVVLTLGKGLDLPANLRAKLDEIASRIGEPQLVLGCDCILRRLEMQEFGLVDEVSKLLEEVNGFGFSTYGEQFGSIHVNQTFTGVVIA